MPATPKPPVKLYEKLGEEAMTDLAGWFAEMDARHQDTAARHQASQLEMDARWQATIRDLNATIQQLKEADARLESKMEAGFAELKVQIAGVPSELIKWTFVFWLGTVGIVVMLLRFLNGAG